VNAWTVEGILAFGDEPKKAGPGAGAGEVVATNFTAPRFQCKTTS